jgi:hypothetical protein
MPIKSKLIEADETISGIHLTSRKYKQAILASVLMFVSGVVLGNTGVAIHKILMQLTGILVALTGFGWLLKIRALIRRNHK